LSYYGLCGWQLIYIFYTLWHFITKMVTFILKVIY